MKQYSTLKTRTPLRAKKMWNPTRTSLKTRSVLRGKKACKKVGKVGKSNVDARKLIAMHAKKHDLKLCELGPELKRLGISVECLRTWPLAPAHRHKRAWYKGDATLLADPKQWVVGCQACHDKIEFDEKLTEEVFIKLRGKE